MMKKNQKIIIIFIVLLLMALLVAFLFLIIFYYKDNIKNITQDIIIEEIINEASVNIETTKNDSEKNYFKKNNYQLTQGGGSVMAGIYTGLSLGFSEKLNETQSIKFLMKLPSIEKLKVYKDGQGNFINQLEKLPLILKPDDYKNVEVAEHAAEYNITASLKLQLETKTDIDSTDVYYVNLEDYTLTINDFYIKDNKLTMAGSVIGQTGKRHYDFYKTAHSLQTNFTIKDQPLTQMFVD